MRMIGRHLHIVGRVQGVFFRAWAVEQARALGLKGWIRNRRDGSVEAVAFGEPQAVDDFIARCRQGSPSARVDQVDVEAADGEPPEDFRTAPTN
ncbi:MAG TPA: acylphosphatase [Allosphingosinicella sp.]|nr:acylphosphatase [Allosphingosinicella sp.]